MTESTSIFILLNSSKHDQQPCYARPQKNLPIVFISTFSEQLKTKQYYPIYLDKSFTVSVFPVPAGP